MESLPEQTRVFLVESHVLFGKAIRHVLESDPELCVVGDAQRLELGDLERTLPQVLVLDLDGHTVDLDETLARATTLLPELHICVVTASTRPETMQRCLTAGVDGFIAKDATPTELIHAIKCVAQGASYADPRIAGLLLRRRSTATRPLDGADLSGRENEIIRLIANGLSNKEISQRLSLSEKTVKNHISRIFAKLNISARTQAAVHAIRIGLI